MLHGPKINRDPTVVGERERKREEGKRERESGVGDIWRASESSTATVRPQSSCDSSLLVAKRIGLPTVASVWLYR